MNDETGFGAGPLSHAIFRVARLHKAWAARLLSTTGLYPGQELVLMTLWRDGPRRQADLVHTLDSDAPTMTRSIARLEKAGLVRKETSPEDRRVTIVEATEASVELREPVERAWAELERLTVGSLSPRRQTEVLAALADVERNLLDPDESATGTGEP